MFNKDQRILNQILTEEQKDAGLWLSMSQDNLTLNLLRAGIIVKSFTYFTATIEDIRKTAQEAI